MPYKIQFGFKQNIQLVKKFTVHISKIVLKMVRANIYSADINKDIFKV